MRVEKCLADFAYAECIPKKVKTTFNGKVGSCNVLYSVATEQIMIADNIECLYPYPTYGIVFGVRDISHLTINLNILRLELQGTGLIPYKRSIYFLLKPFIDGVGRFDLEKWKKERRTTKEDL